MSLRGLRDDRGQAFPIYAVAVVGLLFAALAFFVVGQAGVTRSNAQGAADAAALAAAGEARDNAFLGLDLLSLKPTDWAKLVDGDLLAGDGACEKADEFAALNDATAECVAAIPVVTVTVTTNGTVGQSVVPGTEGIHGKAAAKAAIKPRCSLRSAPDPTPPAQTPSPTPSPSPSPGAGGVTFICDGKSLALDPAKPGPLTKLARVLFTVRLVD
ncbi:pilus assembly protein TadG-related protein [Streptomyces sp. NBC_00320]|uniref:pilus assembly protein TadG-related protein n=1 Tax=Streptomyces sp. NBC_00320 TaxID=2975711 RepID=UPI00224DD76D|nr:pilus assembly protein TadG-related protein [Streptomyces sp. NBC_00320]MCX5145730.1 pilus assembly protein TadG-related protein [Streptomyces sp. NBC_00320]